VTPSAREANRRYFHQAYRSGEHGWATEEPSPYAERSLRRLSKAIPGGRLLDLGCGEGRHTLAAARLGFRAVGVDLELLALERARRRAGRQGLKRAAFLQADVLRLPFPDSCFDVLLDYGCLHHQRKADWPRYRASVLGALRPGGFYVLSAFSPRFRFFRGGRRWHIARGAYRRCFTARELAGLFAPELEVLSIVEQRGPGGGFWHALLGRPGALRRRRARG